MSINKLSKFLGASRNTIQLPFGYVCIYDAPLNGTSHNLLVLSDTSL